MARTTLAALLSVLITLAAACSTGTSDPSSGAQTTPAVPAAANPATAATTAPAAAESAPKLPAAVTDKDGRTVTVTDVGRIVPLNGDIAEVVWALGLGGKVVGVDVSATYPPEARSLPRIDDRRQISAEGVLSLRPSVIIGNDNAGPPAAIQQLRDAGVPVVIIKYPTSIESVPVKIRAVAQALGVPQRGEQLATRTRGEIDAARALSAKATSAKPKVAFLYLRGAGVQQLAGKGTAADSMISAAGATNSGAQIGIEGYKPLTAEAIVTAAPDVLLLLDASVESVGGLEGLFGLPGLAQTPAGQTKRVLLYDDQYLLGMGPRVGQALMDLVTGLHPELK